MGAGEQVFFARSPLSSATFLFGILLFLGVLVATGVIYEMYWRWLPLGMTVVFFGVICWLPILTVKTAVGGHRKLRKLYFQGKLADDLIQTHDNPALGVAAETILAGMIYLNGSILVLLGLMSVLMHHSAR